MTRKSRKPQKDIKPVNEKEEDKELNPTPPKKVEIKPTGTMKVAGKEIPKESVKMGDGKDVYDVEVIKDYYGAVDPFYLSNKDPDYEYRFLRDERKNLSAKTGNMLFQKGGWQIVPREHLIEVLKLEEKYIGPDGVYRVGDTILARIPKKLYQEKQLHKQKKTNEPMDRIKRLTEKGDPKTGGSEIHDSMKGIQTAEALGMK